MDREVQVNVDAIETVSFLSDNDEESYLDYEDEIEMDRFEFKQTKKKIQQKRRKSAGA